MSIILTLIVFSVLVFVHEFGHFIMAKKNGICVVEFSIGMGPRLFSFDKGETKYSWKLVPFGGSCQMLGEDEDVEDNERAFNNKSVWARMVVLAAGPVFNFFLAFVLSVIVIGSVGYDPCIVIEPDDGTAVEEAGLEAGDVITEYNGKNIVISRDLFLQEYMYPVTKDDVTIKYKRDGKEYTATVTPKEVYSMGISFYANDDPAEVLSVVNGSAIEEAGVKAGDVITSINGEKIEKGKDISDYLDENPLTSENIELEFKRDGKTIKKSVEPRITYSIGLKYNTGRVKTGALGVLRYSFTEMRYDSESVIKSLWMLITGKIGAEAVSGPVGIANIVDDAYEQTKSQGAFDVFLNMAYLTVLFSVNLGVVNLIPFPALDGGRLLFLVVEAIRRKPVPKEKEAVVHFVGMAILMVLMVFILFNDIKKII
ncbi:MAG: RIP metalloprotease RseP [Lachnospiraceae bacterium]|nr:RIP metalloprotease RseP [Lachnospiraceae bacterium]